MNFCNSFHFISTATLCNYITLLRRASLSPLKVQEQTGNHFITLSNIPHTWLFCTDINNWDVSKILFTFMHQQATVLKTKWTVIKCVENLPRMHPSRILGNAANQLKLSKQLSLPTCTPLLMWLAFQGEKYLGATWEVQGFRGQVVLWEAKPNGQWDYHLKPCNSQLNSGGCNPQHPKSPIPSMKTHWLDLGQSHIDQQANKPNEIVVRMKCGQKETSMLP